MKEKKLNFGLILAVYLLGIFMGAIDTGIVTPARTVIQNDLSVTETAGIWMITIYTLAYAASIPIMGKLADKFGRKYIYLGSIALFGIGSLFCGLSQSFSSFPVLLLARVVQAIGGGGILPIATAEFGTTFPKEKRGMALGLVGGVYGIANIFGASAGSAIIDFFGTNNWQFIFYINVPITLFILLAGFFALPNSREENVKKIDFAGITVLTIMVLSLLYGLKNIDFFDFLSTVTDRHAYPFLLVFVVLIPVFVFFEKRAEDPVIPISYFSNRKIVITLLISFITGVVIMGMIFVPQFAENALKIPSGSGGYFVIILGVFAGVGAPFSGKLIDRFGVKFVLNIGFVASIAGSLFLIFITTKYPNMGTVAVCLILIGIGIGFTMGTPINYMMLDNTKKEEANSALATVSLVRSIGTAIAPAIMIGFISHAGMAVQTNVMEVLPTQIEVPELPYAKELQNSFTELQKNEQMAEKLKGVAIPDLSSMTSVTIPMNATSDMELSPEVLKLLQSSDVTNITDHTKAMADYMFSQMTPGITEKIVAGVDQGIVAMQGGISDLNTGMDKIKTAESMIAGKEEGVSQEPSEKEKQLQAALVQMEAVKVQLQDVVDKMNELKAAVPNAFDVAKENYLMEIDQSGDEIEEIFQKTLNKGFMQVYLTVVIASLFAMCLMLFYKEDRKK